MTTEERAEKETQEYLIHVGTHDNPEITAHDFKTGYLAGYTDGHAAALSDQWMPIYTAPKDGAVIQGGWLAPFDDQCGTPICWQIRNREDKGGWFMISPQGRHSTGRLPDYAGQWLTEFDYPTHWRPIPSAPVK